jgi:ubiquinone/menaquinone biosynthesis C-methylase UbiE
MSTVWALGDYHRFATATVWELGPRLVQACGISAGQRVLDVAAGSGNVAIRAAITGARATACDVTPENFAPGREAARSAGVEVEWIEGDAQALPFGDGEFDVVTSCFGAMFASNHQSTAGELVRVCRAGGVIGMMNFTPEGAGGDFFRLLAPYMPPPDPGATSPLLWGTEDHVRRLFGDSVQRLAMTRQTYDEQASSAQEYLELFRASFGPMVAIYAGLDAMGTQRLDRAFLDFVSRWNREESTARIPYEYLLVVANR